MKARHAARIRQGILLAREHAGIIAAIDPMIAAHINSVRVSSAVKLPSVLARKAYVWTFAEAAQTAAWTPAMAELMDDIEAAL